MRHHPEAGTCPTWAPLATARSPPLECCAVLRFPHCRRRWEGGAWEAPEHPRSECRSPGAFTLRCCSAPANISAGAGQVGGTFRGPEQ